MRLTPFLLLVVIIGCRAPNAPRTAAGSGASASLADTSGFAIVKLDPALDARG